MTSKYCGKLPRCKNSWWCAIDYRPSEKSECFAIMTNYDRLISKSPEELAELFTHLCCPYSLGGKVECNIENKGCKACWLDWLKAKEGE